MREVTKEIVQKHHHSFIRYTYVDNSGVQVLHRNDGPAFVMYYKGLEYAFHEAWYIDGELHREDGPSEIRYYTSGNIRSKMWYYDGCLFNDGAPAAIHYYENGCRRSEEWFGGYLRWLHRVDGPASIKYDKDGIITHEGWFVNGSDFEPKSWLKENNISWPLSLEDQVTLKLMFDLKN